MCGVFAGYCGVSAATCYTVNIYDEELHMFNIRTREIRELERTLKAVSDKALPYATHKALNDAAFDAMKGTKDNINAKMITRNTWTVRSVRVEKAKRGAIANQKAIVGFTEDYMEKQEFGGTKRGKSIPTTYSAGQSPTAQPRTRVPRKANRTGNIQLAHQRKGKTRKQRNFLSVRSGEKFVYLDLGHRRGIFKITGPKKKPKVNMVQDLTRSRTPIPKTPTLGPAFIAAQDRLPGYYLDALTYQLAQLGAN